MATQAATVELSAKDRANLGDLGYGVGDEEE
jgi:hypothetical protein